MPSKNKRVFTKIYNRKKNNLSQITLSGIFSGAADRVALPNLGISGNATITVELWMRVYSFTSYGIQTMYCHGARSGNNAFGFQYAPTAGFFPAGTLALTFWTSSITFNLGNSNVLGKWIHVAGSYNSVTGRRKLFVNGVKVAEDIPTTPNFTNANYNIGQFGNLPNEPFDGEIDEVRIWTVERTEKQLKDNFNKTLTGPQVGLRAYYKLDEGSGTSCADSSGNGFTGTLTRGSGSTGGWYNVPLAPIYKNEYQGYFTQYNVGDFTKSLYSGAGTLNIDVPSKFDNFGEGGLIALNNQVEVWLVDSQTNDSQNIYTGYIVDYASSAGANEAVKITCAGYVSRLERDIYRTMAGNHVRTLTGDITDILKDIIDTFRANNPNTPINYSDTSISTTGVSRTLKLNNTTYLDAIQTAFSMLPTTWIWYLDSDNIFYLGEADFIGDHLLWLGRDIVNVEITNSLSGVKNAVYFWNNLASSDPSYIAKYYQDTDSVEEYGRMIETKRDGRYTNVSSANDYANRILSLYKDPVPTVKLTLSDSSQLDIEKIKVGQSVQVINKQDIDALEFPLLVSQINYKVETVELICNDYRQFIARQLAEQRKQSDNDRYSQSGPDLYS
ncbi:MAG: hypothetical protein OHK0017_07720 [Patescibacteria group bacterium]